MPKQKRMRKVQSYPSWKQIQFDNITLTRGEFRVTEKLMNAEVYSTSYTGGGWLRLYVHGKDGDYR